jgi:hypothetical protein
MKGIIPYMDDILVYAETIEQHDKILRELFQRLLAAGIRLNKKKSSIRQKAVKFIGFYISQGKVRIDPERIEAIQQFGTPKNRKELQSFLGMVNYLGRFTNETADDMRILRELLPESVEFIWMSKHEEAHSRLKRLVEEIPSLTTYDPKKPIVLAVDASNLGLGAVIMQDGKPLGYGSRTLLPSEQNYSAIEKEMLAIVFGCEKFYVFLYGQEFLVKSDHKPLQHVWGKPMQQVPHRLQRLIMRIIHYRFRVEYVPGKTNTMPDALSRNPSPVTKEKERKERQMETAIVRSLQEKPAKSEFITRLKTATETCPEMRRLKERIIRGWPNTAHDAGNEVLEYWPIRNDLSIVDELVYKNDRIVIPKKIRRQTIESLHKDT